MSPATPIEGFNIAFSNNAWRELSLQRLLNNQKTCIVHGIDHHLTDLFGSQTRAKKQVGDSNRSSSHLLNDN
jgi:hypothetical protein